MDEALAVDGLVIVGANHRSSSLALRDQLFIDDEELPAALAALRAAGLGQACILCTCDRIEVVAHVPAAASGPEGAVSVRKAVTGVLARRAGLDPAVLEAQLYCRVGMEALRHLFAVAASLDSLVIGEPHVLGQVKNAHRLAAGAGLSGPELDILFSAAFGAAKRVRSETRIAEGPVSIAAAAVQTARDLHGDLDRCRGLVVGAGEMGELIAESLRTSGLRRLAVTAPRLHRAETMARALDANLVGFDALETALADADIVVAASGARQVLIGPEAVRAALRQRRRKPMILVDAGIPGDIDPAVNDLDSAFLFDLNDLERIAMAGRAGREAAARAGFAIIEREVEAFIQGRAERQAAPAVVSLRDHVERLRARAVADSGGDAERATRLLVGRLLHAPSETLKEMAAAGTAGAEEWRTAERLLRRLFRLDRPQDREDDR